VDSSEKVTATATSVIGEKRQANGSD